MSRILSLFVALTGLLLVANRSLADGCCPCRYEDREVVTYRTVCETAWKDVEVTRYRPVMETVQVERTCTIPKPVVEMVTRDCSHTVMRPVTEMVARERSYCTYEPQTVQKTIQVDCGHWTDGPCVQTCNGCCPGPRVWCPQIVSKQVACTRMVAVPHRETVQMPVCRLVPETVTRKVTQPVCHMTYEQKTSVQPVTRCKMVPYTCVQKVPYTVTRQVACKSIIRVPVQEPVCDTPAQNTKPADGKAI